MRIIILNVDHILSRQLPDGGWNIYPGGPSEVNASVKAYLSLKLAGFSQDDAVLALARARIHELGAIEKTNTFARLYLALLGQLESDAYELGVDNGGGVPEQAKVRALAAAVSRERSASDVPAML